MYHLVTVGPERHPTLQLPPFIRLPRYYGQFTLAWKETQSFSYLKNPEDGHAVKARGHMNRSEI